MNFNKEMELLGEIAESVKKKGQDIRQIDNTRRIESIKAHIHGAYVLLQQMVSEEDI